MTREMWESLNGAWLEFSAKDASALAPNALPPLFDWIKERSALFRGALLNTILRNDTFCFSQLGTFLERADNTARILDVKYYVLLPHNEIVGGEIDSVQWAAILRSVSAHRSYRWVYKDSYKPWRIADYLILNRQMPRSLRSCYDEIMQALVELGHFYGAVNGPQSLAAETLRQLADGDMNTIFQSGLHEFLADFIARNNRLGTEISATYHFTDDAAAMLITVRHVTRYTYAEPVSYAVQRLRLTPAPFKGQRIVDWQYPAAGSAKSLQFKDGFGNAVDLVTINARHQELVIEAGGTVETTDSNGVVAGLAKSVPPRVFLKETEQTRPDTAIRDLAALRQRARTRSTGCMR